MVLVPLSYLLVKWIRGTSTSKINHHIHFVVARHPNSFAGSDPNSDRFVLPKVPAAIVSSIQGSERTHPPLQSGSKQCHNHNNNEDDEEVKTCTPPLDKNDGEMKSLLARRIAVLETRNLASLREIASLKKVLQGREVGDSQTSLRLSNFNSFKDDEARKKLLSPDTFSFLMFTHLRSKAFLWAMAAFVVQILIFTFLAVNVIDLKNTNNPICIPTNVDVAVRVTQVIAIIVAVVTQENLRTALTLFYQGYREEAFVALEGVTRCKWLFSVTCRFLEGGLGLVVTFFLIMTARTVIDLLLNFTAMEFVSQLDDVAFSLSKLGYVGSGNQAAAYQVENTGYIDAKKER